MLAHVYSAWPLVGISIKNDRSEIRVVHQIIDMYQFVEKGMEEAFQ